MAHKVCGTMSGVVEHHGTVFHFLVKQGTYLGVRVVQSLVHSQVVVPHYLFYVQIWSRVCYPVGNPVGIVHVRIVVAVITQYNHLVAPFSSICALQVCYSLVHHYACLCFGCYGETPYAYV